MLLPLVTVNCKSNNILSRSQTNKARAKLFCSDDQALNSKINKFDRKLGSGISKENRALKPHLQTSNNSTELKTLTNCNTISSVRNNNKKSTNISANEKNKIIDKVKSNVGRFGTIRGINCSVNTPSDDQLTKSKDYCTKKFTNELGTKFNNCQSDCDIDDAINQQDYKTRSITSLTDRFSNQVTSDRPYENHQVTTSQYSRNESNSNLKSKNNSSVYADARTALDYQNSLPKIAPTNFPPLCAPQSIVNVRHPFVTEARTKHNDINLNNGLKSKSTLNTMMQSNLKELEPGRQTYHNFGTSALNITANMSPYPRPDSFPQPTLASLLFPDTSQFSQSTSSYSTNQLNQFQTYDPASYHTTTPVIPQFSDNSLSFPQYDSTNFVQPNHYPGAELTSNQFQYQAPAVGQIQDSLFIQSLQSPITMSDQYTTPNYARAVRTELMHQLRRPPRFSK